MAVLNSRWSSSTLGGSLSKDADYYGPGLALARELVRPHGGELSLASSTGAGTVFRLTLPVPAVREVRRARVPAT